MSESAFARTLRFFESAELADAELALRVATLMVGGRRQEARQPHPVHQAPAKPSRLTPVAPNRNGSIRSRAEHILKVRNQYMTGAELTVAINKEFDASHSKASIVGELARLVRLGETFCRPAPGQYGLIEWQDVAPSPPDDGATPAHAGE